MLYIHMKFSLSIHCLMHILVGFLLIVIMNNVAVNMGMQIPLGDTDFNMDTCLMVGFLDCM